MKFRAIILSLILFYLGSVHFVELRGIVDKHPLYPDFPLLFGLISYNLFWIILLGIALLISITLIFSGVTVKTTNITHVHTPIKEEIKDKDENPKTK